MKHPYGRATPIRTRLDQLRHDGHCLFDQLWIRRIVSRGTAYSKLAALMNLPQDKCHFSMFDESQCELAIRLIRENFDTHHIAKEMRDMRGGGACSRRKQRDKAGGRRRSQRIAELRERDTESYRSFSMDAGDE